MKKILLINPYCPESDHIQPPIGLGYLASALRKSSFKPILYDANKYKTSAKNLRIIVQKENPDFVGFQLYSINLNYVKESLKVVKAINSKIVTIVGGPHPSSLPQEIFSEMGDCLDFGFQGEAEIGLPMLLQDKRTLERIPGLIYRLNQKIFTNPPLFLPNIDQFDFPAWDLLKPEFYPESQHGAFFEKFPIAPIITTRGCPFNCSFCAGKKNTGSLLRKRSVENVIEEIKYLYDKHKIREFHIIDDNFTLDNNFSKKLLSEIIKHKLKCSFAVPNGVRLDTLNEGILNLMKKAGFYLISVGIESGSDRILRLMNKSLLTQQIRKKILLIKKAGLDVAGFFIIGYPGEDVKDIKKTIKFSLNLGLLRANYFLFLPLPGTPIYEKIKNEGNFNMVPLKNFSFTKPFFEKGINKNKLKWLQREAFIRFYFLRPKILLANILKIKRPRQFAFLIRRSFRWLI